MPLKGADYIASPAKRALDINGSLAIAAATLPFSAAVAAESSFEHQTLNPLFIQQRLGKAGLKFALYKFQTLRAHDPAVNLGGADHPHASRAGRLIRNSGLDELPQVVNVLKGDISLVGIRPVYSDVLDAYREMVEDEELFADWHECYERNPGLTGEGQLHAKAFPNHGDPELIKQRMQIDIDAFHNASLASDLRILGRTPLAMMRATV